jgi:hypothetical protein
MAHEKKCSGFPEKGECKEKPVATVLRVQVCEAHAKKAEAKGLRVVRYEGKKS